ncbi:methionine ABC transporter ATP-binding protein [Basilea psittacipulmonis]|uniref:methionine ABC transporter ATP-binding protein n=1 Tax=Basilea psittacipulmonis TaxID=1472345 RepID=UPI00068A871B|nr:methionine ABC transporter ATP-binding protein [Basilea psittacipulmonis]
MIRIEHVTKSYTQNGQHYPAVNDVSLSIQKGEIFGLMGYSGAGKSTLLRLINLLERPDSGQVFMDNQELTALSEKDLRLARQKIGMIFQHFNLMHNWTIYDNIAYPLSIANVPKAQRHDRIMTCLDIVNLADKAQHYPAQLSGGQKQRIGIARALAGNPQVILADEPTSALDPLTTKNIVDCLRDVNQKLNITIIIVTHDLPVIRSLCSRAALLSSGRLIEIATVKDKEILATSEEGKLLVKDIL